MEKKAETGYSYTISGLGKKAFKIETQGSSLAIYTADGKTKQVASYVPSEMIRIKVIFDMDKKSYELIIDGRSCGNFAFFEKAEQIDNILISTSKEQKMSIWLRYVHMYFGYTVNETFLQLPKLSVS